MNLKTGHQLAGGRYRVERVLGQGGFGITYEARDTKFKSRVKSVAIKEFFVKDFCNREQETNRIIVATQSKVELVEKLRNKFIDEANALFELEHPGIVRVTDTFEENGTAYYVMEYINGSSLSTIIETEGPLNENKALGYIRQAASALEYLHGQNRLHLDIKPQNIMVDNDGRVVLIDFGVSKQYDEVNGENTSTLLGSTPGYAPIEQSGSGVAEFYPSTDIYSLGATLYKLLTGNTPLPAHQLASGEMLPPLPHSVSATTRKAVESAMSLNRNNRPQSIGEFLSQLEGNVKAESGKVKTESNDDGETVIANSSTPGGEMSRSDGGENVGKSKDERVKSKDESDGATEILRSAQNDKKRPDNTPKRPSNKRLFTIISVAAICIIAAIFGIKSCNDRKAAEAEAQRATAIAEQERIDADRKAQERADSIAAEQQRLEQERLAKEAAEKAEQERIAAERKAKEEADRKAKEEAERLAAEKAEQERIAAERKVKEEAERLAAEKKRKEEEERKRKEEEYARTHGTINGYEWVDLGLSVKWATCNVGAPSPGGSGRYYAWGETTTKSDYSARTSTTHRKRMNSIAGNSTYDVARREWGGTWRLPTEKEFEELIDNCTWTWTTPQNGYDGYKVTSKKNGNSIFLPANGWRTGTHSYGKGDYGYYWSATPDESDANEACILYFYDGHRVVFGNGRFYGYSVRPVSE